jgi:repressor of nif and glnA expression
LFSILEKFLKGNYLKNFMVFRARSKFDLEAKILRILKENKDGLSITDITYKVNNGNGNIGRFAVRTALAKLEGAKRVRSIQVGMAKVFKIV